MKLNKKAVFDLVEESRISSTVRTHGGAITVPLNAEQTLARTVMTCLLWEDTFYEEGINVYDRIRALIPQVDPFAVKNMAIKARNEMKLRHVPLLMVREMVRHQTHKYLVADTLYEIIQRPDEITEFLAIYWKDGKCPIAAQVKKGLSRAFNKFSEYSLAKYAGKNSAISLKDAMFLVHAKPSDVTFDMAKWDKQARELHGSEFVRDFTAKEELFKKVATETLKTPDTWEVALSGGADKKETFERLLKEKKLGVLAFIRNLRNMYDSKVDEALVKEYTSTVNVEKALPFRFINAAKHAPQWEADIEHMMFRCVKNVEKIPGKTVLIIDISGSMYEYISTNSMTKRLDVAGALAILAKEMCEELVVYSTAGNDRTVVHKTKRVPSRRGFALSDAATGGTIYNELGGGGIFLNQVMDYTYNLEKFADRVIVLTDEQDCDRKANPKDANAYGDRNYIINVASYKNGIAYDKFHHINGWSESVLDYIREFEKVF